MPILNIPTIGTLLTLDKDWLFILHSEYRNFAFWNNCQKTTPNPESIGYGKTISVTLPKGTVLSVSRIYIRNGASDYDSITFSIKECPIKGIKGRFWVKLEDANRISYL
jgi:hypothetical protein